MSVVTVTPQPSQSYSKPIDEDRLFEILNDEFKTEEQQQFTINFRLYLTYGRDDKKFVVDFDKVWKWMGFEKKYNAKRMLIKTFKENSDYIITDCVYENSLLFREERVFKTETVLKIEDNSVNKNDNKILEKKYGGQNKQYIYLNVDTFKNMCMLVNTDKGKETRKYYIKMESIFFKYCEEQTYKKIEEQTYKQIAEIKDESFNFKRITTHQALVKGFNKRPLVYMLQVICPNIPANKLLIKIGYTDDLNDRIAKIRHTFGCQVYALNVFECENNKEFEKFLFKHKNIAPYRYKDDIGTNKVKSLECFLLNSEDAICVIKRTMEKNVIYYKARSVELIKLNAHLTDLNNEKIRLETFGELIDLYRSNPDTLLKALQLVSKIPISEEVDIRQIQYNINKDEKPKIEYEDEQTQEVINDNTQEKPEEHPLKINGNGPKVHQYDPTTKDLIKVFDSISETVRDVKDSSYSAIKNAAKNKTMYMGYRWLTIDRTNTTSDEKQDIGETAHLHKRNTGFVAMLNLNQSEVTQVFANQKIAADFIKQSVSAVSVALNLNKLLYNTYWMYWEDVAEEMKTEYLKTNKLPEKQNNPRGVLIEQVDIKTMEIVKTHNSITDVVKEFKFSPKKIRAIATNGEEYKGFIWRIISR